MGPDEKITDKVEDSQKLPQRTKESQKQLMWESQGSTTRTL
jgi:hypothetical protein